MTVTQPAPATDVAALEARNVTKHFPVRHRGLTARRSVVHAVEGVSLALRRGHITSVVGESGSGKSTLARLFARLLTPTGGELLLDGQPVATRGTSRAYSRRVQLVLQDPFSSLNPVHGVRYVIGRALKIHGLEGDNRDETIKSLLRRVALEPADQFIEKYPHELSGGQRQRVAIARALAVRPEVLLADEPVSMLDVSIRLGVLNLLAELRERERLAVLYVTHDIASARYLADTIVVMYAGRIVESGPAVALTDNPTHPYTQLLLSAAPNPDAERSARLGERGAPPSLVAPPSGCRFHPRCPHAMDICRTRTPPVVDVGAGHTSACWLHTADRTTEATS